MYMIRHYAVPIGFNLSIILEEKNAVNEDRYDGFFYKYMFPVDNCGSKVIGTATLF